MPKLTNPVLPRCRDLEDLHEAIREDPAFAHLRVGKNPLVPGEGKFQNTTVMIIGEAPGADEVMAGRPFVGASDQVLRQLMQIAGLTAGLSTRHDGRHANCWLTNAIKYRPPRNRTPIWSEIDAARPYLYREWQLIGRPKLVVPVGATGLSTLRGKQSAITAFAGKYYRQDGITVWPMFHPAYGLRNERMRSEIENDWEELAEWMGK
jgi:uracil-DNA glycosylase family 4